MGLTASNYSPLKQMYSPKAADTFFPIIGQNPQFHQGVPGAVGGALPEFDSYSQADRGGPHGPLFVTGCAKAFSLPSVPSVPGEDITWAAKA